VQRSRLGEEAFRNDAFRRSVSHEAAKAENVRPYANQLLFERLPKPVRYPLDNASVRRSLPRFKQSMKVGDKQ